MHPVLLGPTIVLAAFSTSHASPHALVRPLIVSVLIGIALLVVLRVATPTWHAAAVAATMALLLVGGIIPAFVVLLVAWIFLTVRRQIWGTPGGAELLTRPLNAFAVLWFAVATATSVAVALPPADIETAPVSVEAGGPNVYLILLDGYPRRDTLAEYFDFDIGPFLGSLEDRGFTVAQNSHSPYTATMPVLTSIFSMQPAGDILGAEWDGSDWQYHLLWHWLNASPVIDAYEAAGYQTYSVIPTGASIDLRSVDVVLESGMPSRFEGHLLTLGIGGFIDHGAMNRAELIDGFRNLRDSAGASPRFVFAHMQTPHDPYVFDADGNPAQPCGAPCANHAGPPNPDLTDRFLGQLQWTDGQVLDAVDHIIAVDPSAVVIVFSDHGLRRDPADPDEWHRSLFAARNASFPDDVTPLGIFPQLLDPAQAGSLRTPSRSVWRPPPAQTDTGAARPPA